MKNASDRVVAGVDLTISSGGIVDYDGLLCAAIRIALRIDTTPDDDFHELADRIDELVHAYIHSPEGADLDTTMLMTRLATSIIDVIPLEERQKLSRAPAN